MVIEQEGALCEKPLNNFGNKQPAYKIKELVQEAMAA